MPVLLIHGLGDTSHLFRRMAAALESAGFETHALDLTPNNGQDGIERLALQIEDYVSRHFPPEQIFDLIGFSMGGIVARFYVQRLGGISRVRRFITISSPHNGTWTARLLNHPGICQMRQNSEFLRDLNSDCDMLARTGFVSIWTRFDLMIVPARSSILPVGRSIHIGALLHPWMVTDARVFRAVREILCEQT